MKHLTASDMKKKQLIPAALLVLLAACDNPKNDETTEDVTVIDVESAMDNLQAELKLSDLYDTVRYVPLETNDSCLIGQWPSLSIVGDYLIVNSYSTTNRCYNFDKETGRFLASIGHTGDDPEAYTSGIPFYNEHDGLLYFMREPNALQKYDAQGNYRGQVKLPTSFPMPVQYVFTDSLITGRYNCRWPLPPCALLTFTPDGQLRDSIFDPLADVVPPPTAPNGKIDLKQLAGVTLAITTFGGESAWNSIQGGDIHLYDGQVKYHADFSDTVYAIQDGHLRPSIAFHTGKYHFPPEGRTQNYGYADKLVITQVTETPERILFFAAQGIYREKPENYIGIYDRRSRTLRMAPTDGTFADDLTGFMPYKGNLIEAFEVVEWLDEHPESKDNPALAPLLQLKDEDNPVVVLVE